MTREHLENEIEQLRPRARAERLLTIADPKRANPWTGSAKRLAAVEKHLTDLVERDAAVAFLACLVRYEEAKRAEMSRAINDEMTDVERQLREIQQRHHYSHLMYRWSGLAHNNELAPYASRLESMLAHNPDAEIEVKGVFPFTEAEIRDVASFKRLERRRIELGSKYDAIMGTLESLLRQHPQLADVAVAPAPVPTNAREETAHA